MSILSDVTGQKKVRERGERRKGSTSCRRTTWAYGEEPCDCHLIFQAKIHGMFLE